MTTLRKLWQILTPVQRYTSLQLLVLLFVGMTLEMLGIGLIIPAVTLMTQSDSLVVNLVAALPLQISGNLTSEQMVVAGLLVLVVVFALKSLFLAFLAWRQMRFIFEIQADLSQRLFAGYLRQQYAFHLQRNSAELIRNATMELGIFVGSGLIPGMLILTELSVALGLSLLLLFVEPVGAIIVVSTLGVAGWIFYHFTRNRVLRWGIARQDHEGLRLQHLQQGLGGVKEIKLLGREEDFLTQYRIHNISSARVGERQGALQALPRLWLELLVVISLVGMVILMIAQGKSMTMVVAALGLFAAAAFRLMPSVNRIINALQSVRYAVPSIDILYSELLYMEKTQPVQAYGQMPLQNALILDHVSFRYATATVDVLHDINILIPRGASVGFVGSSGAGKSTLVDIVLGLLSPDCGIVYVDGIDIQSNLRGWQDQIGYVPQSIFLTDDTLRRNVAFGLANDQIDEEAVWCALCAAQLDDFVHSLPLGLDTIVGERGVRLSGGQRQRIGIARALYHDPSVLVLDEATSALDTDTERSVMDAVHALHGKKTILIVAHRLSTVEYCDRLFRLEKGKLMKEGEASVVLRMDERKPVTNP